MDGDSLKTLLYIIVAVIWTVGASIGKWNKKQKQKQKHRPVPSRRSRTLEELESPSRRSGHTIVIRNIHYYKDHPTLKKIVARYSGWNDARVKSFLNQNTILKIHDQAPYEAVSIIADLNHGNIPVASFNRGNDQDKIILKARERKPTPTQQAPEPPKTRTRQDSAQEEKQKMYRIYQRKLSDQITKKAEQKTTQSEKKRSAYDLIKNTEIGSENEANLLQFDSDEILRGIIYSEIFSTGE